jgi:Leucine-rich repeat (LRR) protein
MRYVVVVFFVGVVCSSAAQQAVPVFANKKDSIEYQQVQSALRTITQNPTGNVSPKTVDSLFQLQATLRTKIIGFKTIFKPKESFTDFEAIERGEVDTRTITALSISNPSFKKLPVSLYECIHLEELELVNTSIRRLPKKLNAFPSLKTIYVFNNKPKGRLRFGKNTVTKQLMIRGVEAKHLPRTYRNLVALEELDLSGNIALSAMPDIYKNKNLKKLLLIGNQITLTDLRTTKVPLQELNLINNKITAVPSQIASFPELKKLVLSNNPVTTVDDAIGQLSELEEVSFYNCKLTELSPGMAHLKKLTLIDLYYNQLTSITIPLENWQNLETLYLSNNLLSALPEDIDQLSALKELYISNNSLRYFPESIGSLTNLRVLRMNGNSFTTFPYALLNLTTLENLDISRNNLRALPAELSTFSKLQIFALVDNPWEDKESILKIIEILRSKGTIVHLNTLEKEIDN